MKKIIHCGIISFLLAAIFFLTPNLMAQISRGSSSGKFINYRPSTAVVFGENSPSFSWGIPLSPQDFSSSLTFAGSSFDVRFDELFSLGTLTFKNGTIVPGTEATSVELQVSIELHLPTNVTHLFTTTLRLYNSANVEDPLASADIVYLPLSLPDRVFAVNGKDYTLSVIGFGAIQGSGFGTLDFLFHVLEGQSASAQLLARITEGCVAPNGKEVKEIISFPRSDGFNNPNSCPPQGIKKNTIWGQFGKKPNGILVSDANETLQIVCAPPEPGHYEMWYTSPIFGRSHRVGICPWEGGQNIKYFWHSGDNDHNGKPDCFIRTQWGSWDYSLNDDNYGPNAFTGIGEPNEKLLDYAVTLWDHASNRVIKQDYKYQYRYPGEPPINCVKQNDICIGFKPMPEGPQVGRPIASKIVDPFLGPETEAFFDSVTARLLHTPSQNTVMFEFPVLRCDLNHDGKCDVLDHNIFQVQLGKCMIDEDYEVFADGDANGCVTERDSLYVFPDCNQLENKTSVEIIADPLTPYCQGSNVILKAISPDAVLYKWSTGDELPSITKPRVQGSVYSVAVTNSNGCQSNASITLNGNSSELVSAQTYISNTQTGNQGHRGELGLEFIVNAPGGILINQLGAFDDGGNGIVPLPVNGHIPGVRVAIFNRATHTIVTGLDVIISGQADAYTGSHRMKNVTPVNLPQGDYVIVTKGYWQGEKNGNGGLGGTPYPVGDDGGGAVTFGTESLYGPDDPAGFAYPNIAVNLGDPHLFLAGTFKFTVPPPCSAAICKSTNAQAYTSNSQTGNQAYRGELGMEFIVNNPIGIIINQLGAFDDGGNGIIPLPGGPIPGIRVAIFNRATHAIVPGLDVTINGLEDNYIGNHRMKDISPVTLTPGDYVIVAKGYHSGERNGNAGNGGGPYPAGDNGGGAITFGNQSSYGPDNPNGFNYPSTEGNFGNTHVFQAGTFNFTKVIPCTPSIPTSPNSAITTYSIKQQGEESNREFSVKTKNLKVYPDPTKGLFDVRLFGFGNIMIDSKITVRIRDINGRLIEQKIINITGKTVTRVVPFNLIGKAPGLYFVEAVSSNGIQTNKFVLQR